MDVPRKSVKDINITKSGNRGCLLGQDVLEITRPQGLAWARYIASLEIIMPRLDWHGNFIGVLVS